jgi:hypothetical protein
MLKSNFQELIEFLTLRLGFAPSKCFFRPLVPQQNPFLGIGCDYAGTFENRAAETLWE